MGTDAEREFDKGMQLMHAGKYKDARKSFQKVVQLDPALPEPWLNLGITQGELNDIDGAIEAFKHVVSIEPKNENGWFLLGAMHTRSGKHARDALAAYQEAVKVNENHADGWVGVGRSYTSLMYYGRAHDAYQRALALLREGKFRGQYPVSRVESLIDDIKTHRDQRVTTLTLQRDGFIKYFVMMDGKPAKKSVKVLEPELETLEMEIEGPYKEDEELSLLAGQVRAAIKAILSM